MEASSILLLYAQCISVGNYNVVWCSWQTNKSAHSLTSESKRLLISGYLLRVGSPVRQCVINKKRYSPRHKKCNACCQRCIPTSCCETKNSYREWNQLSITEIRQQEKNVKHFIWAVHCITWSCWPTVKSRFQWRRPEVKRGRGANNENCAFNDHSYEKEKCAHESPEKKLITAVTGQM